jgi:hypothetical protein
VVDVRLPSGQDKVMKDADATMSLRRFVEQTAQIRLALFALAETFLPGGWRLGRVVTPQTRRGGTVGFAPGARTRAGRVEQIGHKKPPR